MTPVWSHLRSNTVGYIALFIALGGTSYAAVNLPAGSVGAKQLHAGAVTSSKLATGSVTPAKLDRQAIGGSIVRWAYVDVGGKVLGGSAGAHATAPAQPGQPYLVSWGDRFPRSCAVLTSSPGTEGNAPIAGQIGIHVNEPGTKHGSTVIWAWPSSNGTYTDARFYVAVIC
jgi:hypothetical protein